MQGKDEPSRERTGDAAGVARELCELAAEDGRVRDELARDGSLLGGYHPRMEAVHRANAARLASVIDAIGWPTEPLVGARAAEAAWLIAQHAIGDPGLQRRALGLLAAAAARGDVPAWQPAMLEDRVRVFEGRPQRYGTQSEPDADGWLRPCPIEDPGGVEERRRQVGLGPLPEPRREERTTTADERAARGREYQAWLRRVGWRD